MNFFNLRPICPQRSGTPSIALISLALWCTATALAEDSIRLTDDGALKRDPRFVENGESVLYCYDEAPDLIRMMRVSSKGGTPESMFDNSGDKHQLEPAFSPNGRFIAFTECTGNLTARLVIRDLQDGKDAAITHSGRGGTRSPCFAPDSSMLVYAFAETGPQQLWSVRPDGSDKKQLTQCQGISNWPSFTPDGSRIVFANSRENNYEIYIMNVDGTEHRRLTDNQLMDIRPQVSPDGAKVAFTSTRDGNYEIYVMDIDGKNVQRLTTNPERDDYPSWHPDGKHIVHVSERGGRHDVYVTAVP